VPQVGLPRRAHSGWIYLTEAELADPDRDLPSEYDRQRQIRVVAPSLESQQHLIDLLAQREISFHQEGTFPLLSPDMGEIEIYVNSKVDPLIKRCVAKMVFNYLAHVTSREFVLLSAFNTSRAYIRHGTPSNYPIVVADDTPILADDHRTLRQTDGHLVTVNWAKGNQHVVGQLSLFNRVTYRVALARNFTGLWRPICRGHHFDLETSKISPLFATSLLSANEVRRRRGAVEVRDGPAERW
jgi:hypothetical protein